LKRAEDCARYLMKLMIVDDNAQVCHLLKQLVSDIADVIVECSNGEEAVAAYAVEQPDWTLMDLRMERLGGIEATRRIRGAWPEARILIVTEYDDQHWRAAAREAGACGYVLKDDLMEVRRQLQRQA
jgi:two-component system response regulator DegU